MADDLNDQFDLAPKMNNKKRKIDETDDPKKKKRKSEDIFEKGDTEGKVKKKKKKFEKKKSKKEVEEDEPQKAFTPSTLTSAITSHFKGVLSPLEMDKIRLEDDNFSVCNDHTHTAVSLLHTIMPRVKKVMASNKNVSGRPVVVVVCSSALRCVRFIKQIQEFKTDKCTIAKLFAKHLKLDKMQTYLRSKAVHIAVGTPHRINLLLNNGDISLHSTQHIILDLSYKDGKKMNMLQIKIVKEDLMELLIKHVITHIKNSTNNNNNNNDNNKNSKNDKNVQEEDRFPCKIALF